MTARDEMTCGFAPCVCNQGCDYCEACGDAVATHEVNGEGLCGACAIDAVEDPRTQHEVDAEEHGPDYAPDAFGRW